MSGSRSPADCANSPPDASPGVFFSTEIYPTAREIPFLDPELPRLIPSYEMAKTQIQQTRTYALLSYHNLRPLVVE